MVFIVEDFLQDDWDITDSNSRKVLAALSEFDKGVVVTVDMLHKKTSLMPRGLNDAVRHLSKSKLIENAYPEKKFGPYDFFAIEITDLGREVIEKFG